MIKTSLDVVRERVLLIDETEFEHLERWIEEGRVDNDSSHYPHATYEQGMNDMLNILTAVMQPSDVLPQ